MRCGNFIPNIQLLPFLMNTDHAFLGHGCDHFPEPIIHVTQSKPTPA